MNSLSFLNQPLLWGMALASAPIIIHLLFRRRFRRVDWAPMHYLKLSIQRNRRRFRLEQWLLLALRTLIVLLLFFFLARPVMHAAGLGKWLGGRSRTSQLLILDDSLSMGYRDDGRSAFARAQELAVEVLDTLGPKDRFTLVGSSQPKAPLLREVELDDHDEVARLIAGLEPSDSYTSWESTLEAVDSLITSGTYPIREVTILTDLRRAGWDGKVTEIGDRWSGQRVRLRVFDVGSPQTADVALAGLDQVDRVALAGTPTRWEAAVRNLTSGNVDSLEATFTVDGKPSLVRLPAIGAGATVRVPLSATFQEAGNHHVSLSLPADDLPGDDSRWMVTEVREGLHLVLVDGEPSSEPLAGEVDFLGLALALGVGQAEAFRVEVLTDAEWAATPGLTPDLLVLANVAGITPEQAKGLMRLVEGGAGLMIFVGDQVDPINYNQGLYQQGKGLLPAELSTIAEEEITGLIVDEGAPGPLDALLQLNPAVLERIRIRKRYQVESPGSLAPDVRVLARWNDADSTPAVLEKTIGQGKVLLFTVTADKHWSDWPTEPSYVLAVREAAVAIARSSAGARTLTAGEVLRRRLPPKGQAVEPTVEVPGGQRPQAMRLEVDAKSAAAEDAVDAGAMAYDDTARAGLYKLTWKDALSRTQHDLFAVNPDVKESELARIPSEELRRLWGRLEPEVIPAVAAGDAPLAVRGQEIWRTLASSMLCLLALEACFATWAGRQHQMTDILNWLLGVSGNQQGRRHVEFQSLPQGGWAVLSVAAAIVALFGVWYLYKKEGRSLGLFPRLLLASLRLLVLLGVTLMLLEMVVVITRSEFIKSHLLVLVDTSESMALADPYPDEAAAAQVAKKIGLVTSSGQGNAATLRKRTRLELVQKVLPGVLRELGDGRELSLYSFSSKLDPVDGRQAVRLLKAKGPVTGIGDALKNALAAHRGHPIAGVLLVTDGQSNAGEDPRTTATQAGKDGVPIASLAAGTPQGPRNALVSAIETSPVVFVRDQAEISVLVESRGLQGVAAAVTLEQRQQDGSWSEVGREELTLGEDSVLKRTTFRFTPEVVGQVDFRATVADVGPELTEADNTATTSIKVIRQRIRVLVVAGYPSPEMQFLRNALLRDPGLEFSSWLQSAGEGYEQVGRRPLRRLPGTRQELDHYDVLVLFDPDMRALGVEWPEMITGFVGDAGGGLIYIAGELYAQQLFSPGGGDSTAAAAATVDNSWLKVLPVVRDPGLYQSAADVRLSSRETWTLELTSEGAADPIFQFAADPSRNREVLTSLPGMYWHFPVTRAKPGATVLAHHGDPRMRNSFGRHVLLASHWYGPGRAAYLGFDSTYRWRYLHEEYFDGFWARLIDRVGRNKVLGGRYPFHLLTDKSVYRVGDRVTVRVESVSSSDGPGALPELSGEVEWPGEQPQPLELEAVGDDPGVLEASFVAAEPGAYMTRIVPAAVAESGSETRPATLSFRVESPRQELDNPTLDRPLLEDVARATGGQVFSLSEAGNIPSAFKVKEVERVLEERDELWDAPILYGSIFLLLVVEWILRKKYRMA